jgi:sortase B
LNNDLIGYINFPYSGLNLQYPVMQTPENEDFYLSHDFYGGGGGGGGGWGALSCDVFAPSDNIVIYGHNLKTGGMFNKLTYYRNKSYWENHQTFTFDTLYERHTYRIFAVFKTAAKQFTDDGKPWGYPYHRMNNFANEYEFNKFIADVKGAAFNGGGYKGWTFYDTGITPQYGDKLVCLSTCEYTMKDPDGTVNGRWVVMAVRVDEE